MKKESKKLEELAKPEAKPNDVFGQYFDGEERKDVKPSEENTSDEIRVIDAIKNQIVDNSPSQLERYSEMILKLKKQGKYKAFLSPNPGRVYRILWNVKPQVAAKILGLPLDEITSNVGDAWYVSGGGILNPMRTKIQSWSYSLSDTAVNELLDYGDTRNTAILLVANVESNNFILNWKNLANNAGSLSYDVADFLNSEKEAVSVGPVKFSEAAYIYLGDGMIKPGVNHWQVVLPPNLIAAWKAVKQETVPDLILAAKKSSLVNDAYGDVFRILRGIDSNHVEIQNVVNLYKTIKDKELQAYFAKAFKAVGLGKPTAIRFQNLFKLVVQTIEEIQKIKESKTPAGTVKKLYAAFNEKMETKTIKIHELAKPEAKSTDPFGKYFDGQTRPDVNPKEPNTNQETQVIRAINSHVEDGSRGPLNTFGDFLINLKNQGKYKAFLKPKPGRVYRVLWGVSEREAAAILNLPVEEIKKSNKAWYVEGGGTIEQQGSSKLQSWSYSLTDAAVDGLFRHSRQSGVVILLATDTSTGNFLFNWENLVSNTKSLSPTTKSLLKKEKEVVSVGPVHYTEAAYINMSGETEIPSLLKKEWSSTLKQLKEIVVKNNLQKQQYHSLVLVMESAYRVLSALNENVYPDYIGQLGRLLKGYGKQIAKQFGNDLVRSLAQLIITTNKQLSDSFTDSSKPRQVIEPLFTAFNEKMASTKKKKGG